MRNDAVERLRSVDPATDEWIVQEARMLGDVPGRIVGSQPTNVRRFPKAVRRKATLAAVTAVVVLAMAVPLTLMRSLGDGGGSPGNDPGGWVTVGSLAEMSARGVTYVPTPGAATAGAFVIAHEGQEPYALSAVPTGDPRQATRERVLYCPRIRGFVGSRGDTYSQEGLISGGPIDHGLSPIALRVEGGMVQIEPHDVSPGDVVRGESFLAEARCETAGGAPVEGSPGFAIDLGTALPPIAVALPQSGMILFGEARIVGSADVFEATVSIRILDEQGAIIAESFTTATCGTGCRGDYATDIAFSVDHRQSGTVQVFESSAKDGAMTHTVEIPVTLAPAES